MGAGALTALAKALCTYPVLKSVRVWGWGNRRLGKSTGSEVLWVISAEMGVAPGVTSRREEQTRASQGKPSPPKPELSLSPSRPSAGGTKCRVHREELPPLGSGTDLQQLPPHSVEHSHRTPVLFSFLLKLPEGGAAWLRSPQRVLNHKGQAKGCHYPLPSSRLQGSRPVPPTHLIFYSQPRSRSQTGQRTCPARHGSAHQYYLGGRGKRTPRSNHM